MLNGTHETHIHGHQLASIALLALALPAVAPATLTEVGVIGTTTPATVPSCPGSPCLAVSRTTGFQVKVGTERNILERAARRHDRRLDDHARQAERDADQVLQHQRGRARGSRDRGPRAAAQAEPDLQARRAEPARQARQPYFGKTAQFPLETTIPVKKGDVIALTVPSWAPALALGLRQRHLLAGKPPEEPAARRTSSQTAQTTIGTAVQYYCLYQTARLTYSATLISTP